MKFHSLKEAEAAPYIVCKEGNYTSNPGRGRFMASRSNFLAALRQGNDQGKGLLPGHSP